MHYNCFTANSDYDQAHILNEYFFSVFTRVLHQPHYLPWTRFTTAPSDVHVYNALMTVDPNKAQGIDQISPKVWKRSAPVLYYPLYHLCTECLANSTLPTEWQIHTIIYTYFQIQWPLSYKNYRPISPLCIIYKVFERLVYGKTLPFLLQQLTVVQFEFLLNRSAIQQLISAANTAQEA